MNRFLSLVLVVTLAIATSFCTSKAGKLQKSMVGSEQIVERIPSKTPEWIEVPFAEKGKRLYFKGEAPGVHDSALGLRQAKARAVQNMIEAIRVKARSEFSEAVRGVNTSEQALGQYLDSVVAWTTDNVEVTGIRPHSEYREKVVVRTAGGVEYRYNCFVRLAITDQDYLQARKGAVDRAVSVFQDEEARRLAMEAKEKLDR
jgi:hypothetical protein